MQGKEKYDEMLNILFGMLCFIWYLMLMGIIYISIENKPPKIIDGVFFLTLLGIFIIGLMSMLEIKIKESQKHEKSNDTEN